jgi:hypothetical protein
MFATRLVKRHGCLTPDGHFCPPVNHVNLSVGAFGAGRLSNRAQICLSTISHHLRINTTPFGLVTSVALAQNPKRTQGVNPVYGSLGLLDGASNLPYTV